MGTRDQSTTFDKLRSALTFPSRLRSKKLLGIREIVEIFLRKVGARTPGEVPILLGRELLAYEGLLYSRKTI